MGFSYRDGEVYYVQPFNDDPLYAVAADGGLLVTVTRDAARHDAPSRFTVTAWRNGKVKLFSRDLTYRPRRLPGSVVDSVVKLFGQPRADVQRTPVTADSIRRRLYRPAFYPPVEELKVARDGTIWLRVRFADSPTPDTEWLMLSPHGFEMERVALPVSFRLLEADRRVLWGVEGDEMDVPTVVRYVLPERML
jgi:hypothetical protein